MKSIIKLLVLFILVAFILGLILINSDRSPWTLFENKQSENKQIVNNWLTNLKRGGDGAIYWSYPKEAVKLYAVRDWKILKEERVQIGTSECWMNRVIVRVDSSTKGGIRITKTWNINIIGKIWDMEEN